MSAGLWRLTALAAASLLLGCGGGANKKPPTPSEQKPSKPSKRSSGKSDNRPAAELGEEELFTRGKELIERGKLSDGRALLRRYEQRYPRGPHIEEAKLLIAESFFRTSEIDQQVEGVALYRQFLSFYPQHALACTAQLRIGEYYFDQMRSCERDQTETRQAVDEFQKLLATYPNCASGDVAREKLQRAYDRLACADIRVAEFYRRIGELRAAHRRLTSALNSFPAFSEKCYAQRLRIETADELGELDQARADLERMEADCATSQELAKARRVLGATGPAIEKPKKAKAGKKKKKENKKQKKGEVAPAPAEPVPAEPQVPAGSEVPAGTEVPAASEAPNPGGGSEGR